MDWQNAEEPLWYEAAAVVFTHVSNQRWQKLGHMRNSAEEAAPSVPTELTWMYLTCSGAHVMAHMNLRWFSRQPGQRPLMDFHTSYAVREGQIFEGGLAGKRAARRGGTQGDGDGGRGGDAP